VGEVRLVAGVVEGEENAGEERDDDRDHHALEVDGVADVRAAAALGHLPGREEEGVRGLEEGVLRLELAALLEEVAELV